MTAIHSEIGSLTFDAEVGNVPRLEFLWQGRRLTPLHKAVWVGEPEVEASDSVPPVDRRLAGDFVCCPFGASDVEPAPFHGWTANSGWTVGTHGPGWLEATLDRPVMGARITKRLSLKSNAPLLVQTHTITGGEGGLTFAHHPMIDVSGGATLSCSAKRLALTNPFAIVPGAHALALDARSSDLAAIPAAGGGTLDLHTLPIGNGTEDFLVLVEEASAGVGWTALVRPREDDVVFVLKDAACLPLTMLWHSNGGRTDFPWNGRNRGMLGIEDGRCAGAAGHAAALRDNAIAALGVPTHFVLGPDTRHTIRHVIGAIPNVQGWQRVSGIRLERHAIVIEGDHGDPVRLLFNDHHLLGNAAHEAR